MSDPLHGCDVTEVSRGSDTIVYVRMPSGARVAAAGRNPARARALAAELAREVRAAAPGVEPRAAAIKELRQVDGIGEVTAQKLVEAEYLALATLRAALADPVKSAALVALPDAQISEADLVRWREQLGVPAPAVGA